VAADASVAARLIERAQRHPEHAAVVEYWRGRDRRVTFGELAAGVAAVGVELARRGVAPGDRVLLFVPMSAALYTALLGCLHAGATAVFVDAWADRRRLDAAVWTAAPRAFIGSRRAQLLRLLVPSIRRIPVHLSAPAPRAAGTGMVAPHHPAAPDDAALITFTTGSTGAPKAAVRSHGFLWAQHLALASHLGLRASDIDMPTLPIFVLNNLALGVTSVLPDFDPRRPADIRPAAVWAQLVRAGVTTTTGSPAFYDRLLTHGEANGERLPVRTLFTGGAPVLPPLARRLRDGVAGAAHVVYGSTEAEPISGIEVGELLRLSADGGAGTGGVCVGRPVPHVALRILRPVDGPIEADGAALQALAVQPGETGEIVVAGDHVLRGYLNDPVAEAHAKIRDGERVWHRTGDGGRLDGEGRLWLMGRVRERVRRGGEVWWGLPAEVRALGHAAVRHAAYLGVPDRSLGQRALLVVEADAVDDDERADIVRRVAPHPVDELRVLGRIPRDPRHASKTDTEKLRALLGA
jgi:olefin beta-lactone synthetase